jgi:lipopolysaccharide export system permease protein
MSVFGFIIGEVIIPDFSERTIEFQRTFMKKGDRVTFKEGMLWLRGTDGSLIRIEIYLPEKKTARGVSIFTLGDDYLRERIEAEEAEWIKKAGEKGIWSLKRITLYNMKKGIVVRQPEMDYPYLESPDLFTKGIKRPEEMGITELHRYTKRLEAAGIRDIKLSVDLHSKFSYPFSNLFMMLLGISLSVISRIGGGLMAAGLGISVSFIYWLLYTLMLSMGYARILPPIIATWIVPVLFGIIAMYLFRKIPE